MWLLDLKMESGEFNIGFMIKVFLIIILMIIAGFALKGVFERLI